MSDRELEIGNGSGSLVDIGDKLLDAIDLASDQGQCTWITTDGKRIAKIVTAEDGGTLERTMQIALTLPHRFEDHLLEWLAKQIGGTKS